MRSLAPPLGPQHPPRRHRKAAVAAALSPVLGGRAAVLSLGVVLGFALWPTPAAANAPTAPAATVPLPLLGESVSDDFSPGDEKRLGDQIMRELWRDPAYLDDPLLQDHLQSIWQPLVQAARQRGDINADHQAQLAFRAFLLRDRSVNAFALPGGHVGVHLGLIAVTVSDDELASVLAHELSHVTGRHIARSLSAGQRSQTLGVAAMLLGLIAATRGASVDVANAAIVGGQAAAAQAQLNFSRDMEREADRNGMAVLRAAGYAPAGMLGMFERLDQANRLNDSGAYPYLRTHPLSSERIGEARQQLDALQLPAGAAPDHGSRASPEAALALHRLMRERARVLMDPSVQALRRQLANGQQALEAGGDGPALDAVAQLYGASLAAQLLQEPAAAQPLLERAKLWQSRLPNPARAALHWPLQALQAELALQRGDAAAAVAALQPPPSAGTHASDANPGPGLFRRSALLLQARLALAAGQADAVRQQSAALALWLSSHGDDAPAWELAAQTASALQQPLRALRAQAESRLALGDLDGAIERLRAGQALSQRQGDDATARVDAAVIDARLRDLQQQQRAQTRRSRPGGA